MCVRFPVTLKKVPRELRSRSCSDTSVANCRKGRKSRGRKFRHLSIFSGAREEKKSLKLFLLFFFLQPTLQRPSRAHSRDYVSLRWLIRKDSSLLLFFHRLPAARPLLLLCAAASARRVPTTTSTAVGLGLCYNPLSRKNTPWMVKLDQTVKSSWRTGFLETRK